MGCLSAQSACSSVEGKGLLILDGRARAGRAQPSRASVVTEALVPRRSANEMSLLSLPTRTAAGRPESRSCLAKRECTVVVEAPWPPVVSSAKGEK